MIPPLEGVDWQEFLARPAMPEPPAETLEAVARERVLITGAGGSIGSALAQRIAALEPRKLVLMDSAESSLFALQSALGAIDARCKPVHVLGSVLDRGLLDEVFDRHAPTLVFHAAAYKHVPILEDQPLAAIANNLFGTENLASVATRHRGRLILLSTDKAVEPASVMGATKRVAEKIVVSSRGAAVRLGNVLASSGSVAEVFAAQIAAGGPVTVTDAAAQRYFLTVREAVNLLLAAGSGRIRDGVYAADLSEQHKVADLARFLAQELAPDRAIELVFTTPRQGDKESEKLWGASERADLCNVAGLLAIEPTYGDEADLERWLAELRRAVEERDLAPALAALQSLVPEFTPGAALVDRAEEDRSRAVL